MAYCQECGTLVAEGCLCSITSSNCIAKVGDGETTPYSFTPILDPNAANLLTCGASGLMGTLPTLISNPPAVRVYHSAAQNILTATDTTLAFNSERFDTDTMHDNATNNSRLTAVHAGVYIITLSVTWAANASGDRKIRIRLNGATLIVSDERSSDQNDPFDHSTSTIYKLAANDYVEAYVGQNSGSTVQIEANGNYSPEFAMVRIAAG